MKIKVVPDNDMNADGRWIDLPDVSVPITLTFVRMCAHLAGYVPEGHHIVEIDSSIYKDRIG